MSNPAPVSPRTVLFLQGPITPFFSEIGDLLAARGHRVLRINLCLGDRLFWHRPGAVDYRGNRAKWPAFIEDYLDREQVTDIVLLGEQRFAHKVAIAAAQARDITVVATDFGYLRPDWITFERNGLSGDSVFPRDPEAIKALAARVPPPELSRKYHDDFPRQARWDMLYHLASSFLWFLYPGYKSHQVHHPILVYIGTGLRILGRKLKGQGANRLIESMRDGSQSYYVFPLQMQNDFSVRAYSDFDGLEPAIRKVVGSFAQHAPGDTKLVIKIHPLDPGMIDWRKRSLRIAREFGVSERVFFLDGGSLESLLEKARGVVTINSTVGIWALLAGRPLKAMGRTVYDIPGLTFQGDLDDFWTDSKPADVELRDAFVRAMVATIQLRGVYYNRPGLDNAVREAACRLELNCINAPLPADADCPR